MIQIYLDADRRITIHGDWHLVAEKREKRWRCFGFFQREIRWLDTDEFDDRISEVLHGVAEQLTKVATEWDEA